MTYRYKCTNPVSMIDLFVTEIRAIFGRGAMFGRDFKEVRRSAALRTEFLFLMRTCSDLLVILLLVIIHI